MSTLPDPSELIAVGIIRKAHGVHGEASVEPLTDSVDRFSDLSRVYLVSPDGKTVIESSIKATRAHGTRALVQLEGIDAPEALVPYRDWTIEVPDAEARALEEGEYFIHELVGLNVEDPSGKSIGVVRNVIEGGNGLLLAIEKAPGKVFEMPFVTSICTLIDIAGGRLVADMPEGLAELDRVESVEDEHARATRKRT